MAAAVADASQPGSGLEDERLREAIAAFERGDYAAAEEAALGAEAAAEQATSFMVALAERMTTGAEASPSGGAEAVGTLRPADFAAAATDASAPLRLPAGASGTPVSPQPSSLVGDGDEWKMALDLLAIAYEDGAHTSHAEALYLRMLAWREGVDQYRAGCFNVSEQLFKKSSAYNTVDEATWFLRDLQPGDAHAVPEVVGLLALGEQVAAKGALAVWTLALRPEQRQRITECGGLELMAKAVAQHPGNGELQAAGCGTLRLLCRGHPLAAQNRRALLERLGGAEALAASMRSHPVDPEVQREACGAIHAAALRNPAGARRLLDADAMSLCFDAIAACPRDEAVGDAAARAIAAMQCASRPAEQHAAGSAAAEDCEAIWEHRLSNERERCLARCDAELREQLQGDGLTVIQALLSVVSTIVEERSIRHRAVSLVMPIVACMRRLPGYPRVQAPACRILCRLTAGQHIAREEAVAQVACNEGISALCQAMRDLPCNEDVQRLAVGAIRNIAFGNDAYKTLAARSGAIQATIKAMQRFPRDALLQDHAIGSLTSLCDTAGRASLCAKLGGVEAVISALKKHASSGHVAQLGCVLLCMFCDDAQLRQHIVRSGALSVAKTLSRIGNAEAQRWGCELLRDLSDTSG